jgi:Papain family cysteine protease
MVLIMAVTVSVQLAFPRQHLEMFFFISAGGWPSNAFKFIKKTGVDGRKDYKYKNKKLKCESKKFKPALNPEAISKVHEEKLKGNETRLAQLINQFGPVAAGIFVTPELMAYGGGVYLNDRCKKDINHAIVGT